MSKSRTRPTNLKTQPVPRPVRGSRSRRRNHQPSLQCVRILANSVRNPKSTIQNRTSTAVSGPIGFEHERIAAHYVIASSNRRIAPEYLADSLRSSVPENRNSRRPPLGGQTALNTERCKTQRTIDRLKRHQRQEI